MYNQWNPYKEKISSQDCANWYKWPCFPSWWFGIIVLNQELCSHRWIHGKPEPRGPSLQRWRNVMNFFFSGNLIYICPLKCRICFCSKRAYERYLGSLHLYLALPKLDPRSTLFQSIGRWSMIFIMKKEKKRTRRCFKILLVIRP
jgi:hypothetical protein